MTWPTVGRRSAPLVAAAALLGALALAGPFDGSLAGAAAQAPKGDIHIGVLVSRIGLSWYMLVLSAAMVLAASLAPRWAPGRLDAARARVMALHSFYVFAAVAGSGLVCQAIKHLVGRARPRFLGQFGAFHFDGPNVQSGLDSFPSGHTTTVFAAATALSLLVPAWRVPLFGVAALVGAARILAGAHYPSDVIAGAALGVTSALWIAGLLAARGFDLSADAVPEAAEAPRTSGANAEGGPG